jgi:hypothetical protein
MKCSVESSRRYKKPHRVARFVGVPDICFARQRTEMMNDRRKKASDSAMCFSNKPMMRPAGHTTTVMSAPECRCADVMEQMGSGSMVDFESIVPREFDIVRRGRFPSIVCHRGRTEVAVKAWPRPIEA